MGTDRRWVLGKCIGSDFLILIVFQNLPLWRGGLVHEAKWNTSLRTQETGGSKIDPQMKEKSQRHMLLNQPEGKPQRCNEVRGRIETFIFKVR